MSSNLPLRGVAAALLIAALGVAAWRWVGVLHPPADALAPSWSDATPSALPALERHPHLARWWAHAGEVPGATNTTRSHDLEQLAAVALPLLLSNSLTERLDTQPELIAAAALPALGDALGARCPDLSPATADRCRPDRWSELQRDLPGALAYQIVSGEEDVRAEALELACARADLTAPVQAAMRAAPAARDDAWRATADALLAGCAGGDAAPPGAASTPADWGRALAGIRAGDPTIRGLSSAHPERVVGVLGRYGALLEASDSTENNTTDVPPSP